MRRKLLMGVFALALPVGTLVAFTSAASAKNATDPVNCTGLSATVNFAPPGLSQNGATQSSAKPVITTVTAAHLGDCKEQSTNKDVGGAGVGSIKPIKLKPTKVGSSYSYDKCSQFTSSSTLAAAEKGLKKLTFSFAGGTVKFKTTGFNATFSITGEVGFQITGTAKGPYGASSAVINAYLGADSGPGTSGNFTTDIGCANPAMTIVSAQVDPATSNAVL